MTYSVLSILVLILLEREGVFAATFQVRVEVPKNVASGSTATLHCRFVYDTKAIYSVKWYRGNREFFRVMPNEQPSIKTFDFPVGKLYINITASNISQVTLRNVSPILSGQFTCEVTVLPSLAAVSAKETLYIYDPVYLTKPTLRTEEYDLDARTKTVNVLCGFDVANRAGIGVPVEKIPFVFYVNQRKIDPTFTVYDDYSGFLILNTSLLRWKDRSEKRISCSANLPGTSGLRSDELLINASKRLTADAFRSSTILLGMVLALAKWCS